MLEVPVVIISLISVFTECESARILGVFPTPSLSHQFVFRPLMHELARRGHKVTVITTDPAFSKERAPANLIEIDMYDISYKYLEDFGSLEKQKHDPINFLHFTTNFLINLFEKQLNSSKIQDLLRSDENFDLVFAESWVRPALIFSHIYDAPVIEFSSLGGINMAYEMIGAASHPLIYPNAWRTKYYNLTLWEKITELYIHYSCQLIVTRHEKIENKILKSILGSNIPDLNDLRQNVRMLFLNVYPLWDFNRPVPPNVLYLGGMHQKPQKDLTKDLKSYLDSSKNGVIYVSFGSNIKPSKFQPKTLKIFNDVFSQLPYDILWKWDTDELPGSSNNVKISKWLPQSDLLRHKNVKLFITQGGLQSTDEALTAGVPLIGIPMVADQWYNVEQYVKFNIGKQLSFETLTEDQLMDAIKTVIGDISFTKNIVKLHSFMTDQPQSSLESAVFWTEHVLRHPEVEYRRTPAAKMNWTEYYELEIVLILLSALITLLSVTVLVIKTIVSNVKYYMRFKVKVN